MWPDDLSLRVQELKQENPNAAEIISEMKKIKPSFYLISHMN